MKPKPTVPLSKLLLEVIKLKVKRSVHSELLQTIAELQAYANTLQPKRARRSS